MHTRIFIGEKHGKANGSLWIITHKVTAGA